MFPSDDAIRKSWTKNSELEIYSNSQKKWFVGKVEKIQTGMDGITTVTVMFGNGRFRKTINRMNTAVLRPCQNPTPAMQNFAAVGRSPNPLLPQATTIRTTSPYSSPTRTYGYGSYSTAPTVPIVPSAFNAQTFAPPVPANVIMGKYPFPEFTGAIVARLQRENELLKDAIAFEKKQAEVKDMELKRFQALGELVKKKVLEEIQEKDNILKNLIHQKEEKEIEIQHIQINVKKR